MITSGGPGRAAAGAMYKREEDGIVLVDQDRCRGWRFCVSGCPYKKVYFNHRTGKAEKCTLCFPRIESGQPTICSETCVGRLRYLGLVLYDADKVLAAAATPDPQDLYQAQLSVFLDPADPVVAAEAARQGIPVDWIDAAVRSPVYALAVRHRVALPLHPEYRTLPMVWYIPPLSPVADAVHAAGYDETDPDQVFATIDALRIPAEYLANLFTAGDADTIRAVLRKLAAKAERPGIEVPAAVPQESDCEHEPDSPTLRSVGEPGSPDRARSPWPSAAERSAGPTPTRRHTPGRESPSPALRSYAPPQYPDPGRSRGCPGVLSEHMGEEREAGQ
jgi:nitrate reductase beta subunit